MRTLLKNIKGLYGITMPDEPIKRGESMRLFNCLENAWLLIENQRIIDFGSMPGKEAQYPAFDADKSIDVKGKYVLPSFVDSHTHLVFAESRESEFVMKIKGKTYEEIAAAGGGILNSAEKIKKSSERELYEKAKLRLQEVISQGTGAIEIKSGYGLSVNEELKMLRVIKRLKEISPIPIKSTFLGAHTYPMEYKNNHEGYISLIVDEMLPAIAAEALADYIDVFCEKGFFSKDESNRIIQAGYQYGLKAKIHGNQLGHNGGIEVAVANQAISVDHLEYCNATEIELLRHSQTIPVSLPGCSFFLGLPYTPGREIIDAGLPLCLASDYNPGSSPSGRMSFIVSLACIQMKLLPEEAFNASTIVGAHALELENEIGSIAKGKLANLIITKEIPSLAWIPYAHGSEWIEKIIIKGK